MEKHGKLDLSNNSSLTGQQRERENQTAKEKKYISCKKQQIPFIKELRKYISHLAAAGMEGNTSRFSVSVVGTEKPKPGPCVFKCPSSEKFIPKDQWPLPLAAVRSALTEFEKEEKFDKVRLL